MDTSKINVNLNLNQVLEAVKQFSPKDRLKINDAIWKDDFEVPLEHQKIVLARIEKAKKNPERLLDWDIVSKNF